MSTAQVEEISQMLLNLSHFILKVVVRKHRSLHKIDRMKLCTFVVHREDCLERNLTSGNMTFSHSQCCHILASSGKVMSRDYYTSLWLKGCTCMGMNFIQAMIHIALDIEEFECLHQCSAFTFENYHQTVRSGKNPLAQVVELKNLTEPSQRH